MKKSLLLAAALVCSGAAQAETYICEVKTWQIGDPQGNLLERDYRLRTDDGVSIYIDTSRGFRDISPEHKNIVMKTPTKRYDHILSTIER